MLVSFLAIGWRAGLVVGIAIPVTLGLTFMLMQAVGMNLDRITLGALIIGLGLLVDDAIIAIEMMLVKMEAGGSSASMRPRLAWRATAAPMLFGTLVTVAGFRANWIRSLRCRRIRRQHLLGAGLCAADFLAGGGDLHALSGCGAAAGARAGGSSGPLGRSSLRDQGLPQTARMDRSLCSPSQAGGRRHRWSADLWRWSAWPGPVAKQFFSRDQIDPR